MVNRRVASLVISHDRHLWVSAIFIVGWLFIMFSSVHAQQTRDELHEPVFRISRTAKNVTTARDAAPGVKDTANRAHPLDEASTWLGLRWSISNETFRTIRARWSSANVSMASCSITSS